MRRIFELPLVLALSIMTVSTTVVVLQDAQTGHSDFITRWIGREWQQAQHLIHGSRPSADATSTSGAISVAALLSGLRANAASPMATPVSASSSPTQTWSPADVKHLAAIATRFARSATPADWSKIGHALVNPNSQGTSQAMDTLLRTHLSSQDIRWIQERFSGATPFDATDLQLFEQSVGQFESELTSDERKWLTQAFHQIGGTTP